MKRALLALTLLGIFAVQAPAQDAPAKTAPKSETEKYSYALGAMIGRNVTREKVALDVPQLLQGLITSIKGNDLALSDEEVDTAMQAFQRAIVAAQQKAEKELADTNKAAGEKYLAENKKKKGVKVTESGLQYEVLKAGTGPSPKKTDQVKAHYHGTFIDGAVFDSSVQRGEPLTIPVNRVIEGWSEALQLMHVGDKWRLVIPSELAYGSEQLPGSPIGPNSVLVFEVELLGIEGEGDKE